MPPQKKSFGIELTRVLACVMIVVTHVTSGRYEEFHDSWSYLNTILAFSRGGAVLFLMITGALLMNRQESLGLVWKKRILKILPPLFFWGVVYLLWRTLWGHPPARWSELFYTEAYYHLWYLYAIIGIYAFLPLFRRIYVGASSSERWYYLAGWFLVASVWPLLKSWLHLEGDYVTFYQLTGFTGLAGYLFAGAWIYETRERRLGLPLGLLLCLLILVLKYNIREESVNFALETGHPQGIFFDHLSPFLLLASLALFALLVRCGDGSGKWRLWIKDLSACTFGVYLVHPLVLESLSRLLGVFYGTWHLYWSVPLISVLTLALSVILVKKLKGFSFFRYVL